MKQEVKFAVATASKSMLDISIMNANGTVLNTICTKMPPKLEDALFSALDAVVDNVEEENESIIFVTNDPRAQILYGLRNATDTRWQYLLEKIVDRKMAIGTMKRDDKSFQPPIRYDSVGFVTDVADESEPVDIQMDELQAVSGRLANDGRWIIAGDAAHLGMSGSPKIIKILLYKSVSLSDRIQKVNGNVLVEIDTEDIGVGENRASRLFEEVEDPSIKVTEVQTMTGQIIRVQACTKVLRLRDKTTGEMDPLIVFEGSEQPLKTQSKDPIGWTKWKKSAEIFKNGMTLNGKKYQFGFISAAGQRTISATFIRSNVKVPTDVLEKIPEWYRVGPFSKLTEIEKIYDILSYGGYLKLLGTQGVANKINTRFGLALSTSNGLGSITARTIGRVIVPLSDMIIENYRDLLINRYGFSPERAEENIELLKHFWKEDAVDGFNIITAEGLAELLNNAKIKSPEGLWNEKNIIGLNVQFRYAFVKGMATCLPRDLLWSISYIDKNGKTVFPYRGFDLLCEKNSVKNEWAHEVYTGELAPSFELVGMTKDHGSNFVDPQLITCCEFRTEADPNLLKERIKQNCDAMIAEVNDIRIARTSNGVIGRSFLGDEELNPYGKKHRSLLEGALQAIDQESGPVEEPKLVKDIISSYFGMGERAEAGKIAIDGERWHMVPDFSVFWKGQYVERDEVDFLSGLPLFDIIVTKESQTVLSKPGMVWACGKTGPLAMYRNPLNKRGEIVHSDGISINDIRDEWAREIFSRMRCTIILSVFSASANLMGGGDFDGDLAMVIWDAMILKLLHPDDFVLVEVETAAKKIEVNYENLKNAIANSLCNAGIGLVTNYGSTWAELAHVFKWFLVTQPKTVRLPKVWYLNFDQDPEAPEFRKETFWDAFLKVSEGPFKGLSLKAVDALNLRGESMSPKEKTACEAIANLKNEPFNSLLKKETLSYAEFEKLAGPFLAACEGGTTVVRYLQELAINTAKSDVWAFYQRSDKGELIRSDKYSYIAIMIRPYWKRTPNRMNTFEADYTPMGVAASYASLVFDSVYKSLMSSTAPIEALSNAPKGSDLYKEIDALVLEYNARKKALSTRLANAANSKDEDAVMKLFALLNIEYRSRIAPMLYSNSIVNVLKAAYTATYAHADKMRGGRMSFVYGVLGDEFIVWLNNSSKNDQIVPIPVSLIEGAELSTGSYEAEYDYMLKRSLLRKNGELVGLVPCKPANGMIDVFVNGDRAFAQAYVPRVVKRVSNKDFGHQISVLGLRDYAYSERQLMEAFRAKIGIAAEKQAYNLGEHQDLVRFVDATRTDVNGLEIPVISMRLAGVPIGNVAPEHMAYVRKIMSYGDIVIVEWVKNGRAFAPNSARIRVVDVVAR